MKKNFFTLSLMAVAIGTAFTSCSSDDTDGGSTPTVKPEEAQFVVFSGDPKSDLKGGIYMKAFSDLTSSKNNQEVYGDSINGTKCFDSFTQETYNANTGVFTGYIYARGASEQGIGSLKAGLRSYKLVDGKMKEIASPVIVANFGNTGTFGNYSYAAQISNPTVMVVDQNGVGTNITIDPTKYAIDGTNPAIGNIVDLGNNKVAMILNYSNRDSAVVAFADYNLNISNVVYTDKIGSSVGSMRSVRYSQSAADDEGNLYVFSGQTKNSSKVGAVRIKKGESNFDPSYKFNIFEKSGGYRFRKVFHISDDYFLIEFFNTADAYENMSPSGKIAVVKMSTQELTWVTGLPDPTTVSISWGDGLNGKYYLPIAAPTEMSGGGGNGGSNPNRPHGYNTVLAESAVIPTIYQIDAKTGVATPFITFATGDLLKSILILK